MSKKALIIGLGSIGKRHFDILESRAYQLDVVSKFTKKHKDAKIYSSLDQVPDKNSYDLVLIANNTSAHESSLLEVKKKFKNITVLVEKPLFGSFSDRDFEKNNTFVAFNLRYHPLIQKLKNKLSGHNILQVNAYVGQYLPTWRPGTDYKSSYSAKADQGGGVLRDLSHELDLLMYLFGPWSSLTAIRPKKSHLDITSDDSVMILGLLKDSAGFSLNMNYTDRIGQRQITVVTDSTTFKLDLVNSLFYENNKLDEKNYDPGESYKNLHEALEVKDESLCTFDEGMAVEYFIKSAERSINNQTWEKNEFM